MARNKSTGMKGEYFISSLHSKKRVKTHIYDVAGARSERKKWINAFGSVHCIVFCASLINYDLFSFEKKSILAMIDSVELFGQLINDRRHFGPQITFVLLLTKTDLFKEKWDNHDAEYLKQLFTNVLKTAENFNISIDSFEFDFENSDTMIDSIRKLYLQQCNHPSRRVYSFIADLTDRNDVEHLFDEIQTVTIGNMNPIHNLY